jgi:hypothetical protein
MPNQGTGIHGREAVAFAVDLGHDGQAFVRDRKAPLTNADATLQLLVPVAMHHVVVDDASGLQKGIEHEIFEPLVIIMHRHAPFLVMVVPPRRLLSIVMSRRNHSSRSFQILPRGAFQRGRDFSRDYPPTP